MGSINLVSRTQHLLKERPRTITYDVLAKNVGGISEPWLRHFARGARCPDANKVQALYEYLSGTTLFSEPTING